MIDKKKQCTPHPGLQHRIKNTWLYTIYEIFNLLMCLFHKASISMFHDDDEVFRIENKKMKNEDQ